jgi:hypothetical protein
LFLVHFPVDGYNPTTPSRSTSQTKSSGHKSKSSSAIKRKHGKTNVLNGDAKWYLENLSSMNTNNNNNNNDNVLLSTPITDQTNRKLGKINVWFCFSLL